MTCHISTETLIENGFAANEFILDLNGSLHMTHGDSLPAPWNLPSRLFQFPVEVRKAAEGWTLGMMHPLLSGHPFVQHVEKALGVSLDPNGAPNEYGYTQQEMAQWWHAVDLISSGHWQELLDTRHFTTPDRIAGAVSFGLRYSSSRDESQRKGIDTKAAREIMREIDSDQPSDPAALLCAFDKPHLCQQDKGAAYWPINGGPDDAALTAWGMIFGIERGWFKYDRSGFLHWSQAGRDRYAAGTSDIVVESKTGQAAFAF